jgi:hypothetical protein
VIHAGAMGRLIQQRLVGGKSINTWMAVQSAEAYAANGAYVQYYIESQPILKKMLFDNFWVDSSRHAEFIQAHRELYDGDLGSGSQLAVVFLMNERGRTIPAVFPSYLGFAQGLIECNIPFDVVFAGDGHYVRDRLAPANLASYETLLVPSPISPTENQKVVIRDFVQRGGTVICQEPGRLGLTRASESARLAPLAGCDDGFGFGKGQVYKLRGDVSETWTDDIGSNFFKTYESELRNEIGRLAEGRGMAPLTSGEPTGLVGVFPVSQRDRKRLLVHLVNYDIDYAKDAIRDKTDVVLNVPRPAFLSGAVVSRLYTVASEPQALTVVSSEKHLRLSVPRLGMWGVVVVESEQ